MRVDRALWEGLPVEGLRRLVESYKTPSENQIDCMVTSRNLPKPKTSVVASFGGPI